MKEYLITEEEIKEKDYVIDELNKINQIKNIEDIGEGNKKYWFISGKFGLKDETKLRNPNNFYKKIIWK